MKGVKLCFGLSLLLFIMVGLSLSVSSDVNALKYSFDSFSFADRLFYNPDCDSNSSCSWTHQRAPFRVDFYQPPSNFNIDDDLLDLDDNYVRLVCPNGTKFNIFDTFRSGSGSSFQVYSSDLLNLPYAGVPPSPLVTNNMYSPSCSYSYDSVFASETNLSNGDTLQVVDFSNMLFDTENPGYDSGKISYMSVPLTLSSDFDVIPSGTVLEFDFGLVTKSANNFPYLSSNFTHKLDYSYFTSPADSSSFVGSFVSNSSSCSIDTNYRFTTRSSELWQDYLGFNVHCSFTAPSDIYYFRPLIVLSSSSYFLEYDYHGVYFSGSFLTTNNDSTWSGSVANPNPTGSDLTSAPGYHQIYGYEENDSPCYPGDFLCDLSHLFDFSFINPFAPIFGLFNSVNQCVEIPTIAGMIHAEDATVCPWFDSTTRNIATPVIGLSAMMLVFGFAVRWLGARSGNFIEDSGGIDSGGKHFENKYRRGK